MKVNELLDTLQHKNPDAEVRLLSQPNWPFEYALYGVVVRQELFRAAGVDTQPLENKAALDDVLLVEGEQIGYGWREAWPMVRQQRGRSCLSQKDLLATSTRASRTAIETNHEETYEEARERDEALEAIARRVLRLETLTRRGGDSLDFHDMAVWTLHEALEEAYRAGAAFARSTPSTGPFGGSPQGSTPEA